MKLLARLILLPVKFVVATVETVVRAARLLGFRGMVGLVLGLAVGLFFAPGPGRELRGRVRQLLAQRSAATDADLADRVAFELEHAPRTWHLPQPAVTVDQGRVVLEGTATEPTARDELARVAGAVPGVTGVENLVVVDAESTTPGGGAESGPE